MSVSLRHKRNWVPLLSGAILLNGFASLSRSIAFAAQDAGQKPAVTETPAAAEASPVPATYRIEPDDVLEVVVLGEADLPRTVTVLPDGTFAYPYVGQIKAAGLTVPELTARIAKGLKSQIRRPQVTVLVSRRGEKSVNVLGVVKNPGKTLIQEGWRVLDVLAATGGISAARPEWTTGMLVRSGGGGSESIPIDMVKLLTLADPEQNPPVRPGDILLVSEREVARTQVQVLGEVLQQGVIPIPSDGSVLAALAASGGAKPEAALARAVIRRGSETIPVDINALLQATGNAAPGPTLQPGDTLVIPQNTRRFAVIGGVTRPGAMFYPEDKTLDVLSAITLAGGQTNDADLKNVTRLRPSTDGGKPDVAVVNVWEMMKKGDLSKNLPIEPGDVLFVPDKASSGKGMNIISAMIPTLGWLLR